MPVALETYRDPFSLGDDSRVDSRRIQMQEKQGANEVIADWPEESREAAKLVIKQ